MSLLDFQVFVTVCDSQIRYDFMGKKKNLNFVWISQFFVSVSATHILKLKSS
jgi:hypothetical protein